MLPLFIPFFPVHAHLLSAFFFIYLFFVYVSVLFLQPFVRVFVRVVDFFLGFVGLLEEKDRRESCWVTFDNKPTLVSFLPYLLAMPEKI